MVTFFRVIKLGFNNFWRNHYLTLGATLLMTLTLTMISVSLILSLIVRDTASSISSKIDIAIYFRDDSIPDGKIAELETRIKTFPQVTQTRLINKEVALSIWGRLPINEQTKQSLSPSYNPLPRSIEIKIDSPENIERVVLAIEKADTDRIVCSECVSYGKNKEAVDRLISITRLVQRSGIFLSLFFGIIAVFNVLNIIRITIATRADEIEIMRYVGASNAFVRGPFIVEGILYGVLSTILTTVFILLITKLIAPYTLGGFSVLGIDFSKLVISNIWFLIAIQLGVGVVVGVVVSLISIRRYLKA